MNPFQKRPGGDMPGLGSPSGMDAPPPLPPKAAPPEPDAGAGGSQAEMTCPTCGDKITVTLAPAEVAPDDQGGEDSAGAPGADSYQ